MKSSKEEIINDFQRVYNEHGKLTRFLYRLHGKHSERQVKKNFGNFKNATEAAIGGISPEKPVQTSKHIVESKEIVGDKLTLTLPETHIDSLEKLIEHFKVDTTIWKVGRFKANAWEMGYKDSTGKAKSHPLYQTTATFVRNPDVEAAKKEIASLAALAKTKVPTEPYSNYMRVSGTGNMLEINIPDAHFGKLAWGKETGYENYDTTIAEHTFLRALETLVQRAGNYRFDKVLFVVGNDLLNSDDLEGRTTKGTYVSTDGRYHKTFSVVRNTIIKSIERLRMVAPVKVIMVSGNHDDLSVWHLGDSLTSYFYHYKDVEINNSPKTYKYHQHGNVMLMFTHGDKGNRIKYPQLMAREEPEMWGATKFRECHTGHTHMTKLDEQFGCRVRVLPALCPPDAWHAENGFVGNQRNAEAFVWNDKEGLISQVFYNDEAYPPITTKTVVV